MQFGIFTEFECPPDTSEAAAFDASMAQMVAAEALGFDDAIGVLRNRVVRAA